MLHNYYRQLHQFGTNTTWNTFVYKTAIPVVNFMLLLCLYFCFAGLLRVTQTYGDCAYTKCNKGIID